MYLNFKIRFLLFVFWISYADSGFTQSEKSSSQLSIARIKYSGGGDWYNDPSCIPNLLQYLNRNTNINASNVENQVSLNDNNLYSYPVIFLTGHGRISLSEQEIICLRNYLMNGGFLYADDDYGLDDHFRREMKKVFPNKEMVEIPFSHPIFHIHYEFANGLPKIHEHDGKPPQGFGYFHEGRLVVFYTYSSNISDGWADVEVHNDPPEKRDQAFKMATNIIVYALIY
jgi:hypothetical protein